MLTRHLRYSSIGLLLAEVLFIVSSTWWPAHGPAPTWAFLVNTTLFCVGGYLLIQSKNWLKLFLPIAIFASIANFFGDSIAAVLLRQISLTLVLGILFYAIFHHSFVREKVTKPDRILAGISGYLLLGILWGTQFILLAEIEDDTLFNTVSQLTADRHETLYFGFITLTAVGYGEIVPVTPVARTLTIFASLSGVLYLAIFISSLVGSSKK